MTQFDDEEFLAKITRNHEKFVGFCKTLGDRSEPIMRMVEHLGDRLVTAPASSREAFHNAWPGGLIDHSLRVLSLTIKLVKAYELSFPKESIVISALFHDLGKVGGLEKDHYIAAEDWQKKRGQLYTYNPALQYMTNSHRSLFLLQHFGVPLTEDEYLAIMLNDGPEADENRIYSMKEPTLAVVIHQADRMACEFEKSQAAKQKAE